MHLRYGFFQVGKAGVLPIGQVVGAGLPVDAGDKAGDVFCEDDALPGGIAGDAHVAATLYHGADGPQVAGGIGAVDQGGAEDKGRNISAAAPFPYGIFCLDFALGVRRCPQERGGLGNAAAFVQPVDCYRTNENKLPGRLRFQPPEQIAGALLIDFKKSLCLSGGPGHAVCLTRIVDDSMYGRQLGHFPRQVAADIVLRAPPKVEGADLLRLVDDAAEEAGGAGEEVMEN